MDNKPQEKKDLEKKPEAGKTQLAVAFGQAESGGGLENVEAKHMAVPFLNLLQTNSPQVMLGSAKFMDGARAGLFLDSSLDKLMPSAKIIPCHFDNKLVEWVPRDMGGGFVQAHELHSGIEKGLPLNEKLEWIRTGNVNGKPFTHVIKDTFYFFSLLLEDDADPRPVVLAFQSTQIKKAKNWITKMKQIRAVGKDGKKFEPPSFSRIYNLTSVPETNAKGSYYGMKIAIEGPIPQDNPQLYELAKKWNVIFRGSKPQMDNVAEEAE